MNEKILDFETKISALRQTYKENHPDIRSQEAQLAVLKKRSTVSLVNCAPV